MPYIYTKSKKGKIESFYIKDKSLKIGDLYYETNSFSQPRTIIKIKYTKRDE